MYTWRFFNCDKDSIVQPGLANNSCVVAQPCVLGQTTALLIPVISCFSPRKHGLYIHSLDFSFSRPYGQVGDNKCCVFERYDRFSTIVTQENSRIAPGTQRPLLSPAIASNHIGSRIYRVQLCSRNILSARHILSTILNHSIGLFGNILHVSCWHRQVNTAEESLNCKWISRPRCHRGSGSVKRVEACSLRRVDPNLLHESRKCRSDSASSPFTELTAYSGSKGASICWIKEEIQQERRRCSTVIKRCRHC